MRLVVAGLAAILIAAPTAVQAKTVKVNDREGAAEHPGISVSWVKFANGKKKVRAVAKFNDYNKKEMGGVVLTFLAKDGQSVYAGGWERPGVKSFFGPHKRKGLAKLTCKKLEVSFKPGRKQVVVSLPQSCLAKEHQGKLRFNLMITGRAEDENILDAVPGGNSLDTFDLTKWVKRG